jgi:hypothetical protein
VADQVYAVDTDAQRFAEAVELVREWVPRMPIEQVDRVTALIGEHLVGLRTRDAADGEPWSVWERSGAEDDIMWRLEEWTRLEDFEEADTAVFYAASEALYLLGTAMEGNAAESPRSQLTFRQLSNDTLIVDLIAGGEAPPEWRDVARVKGFASDRPELQIMRPLGCDAVQRILDAVRSGSWQTMQGG